MELESILDFKSLCKKETGHEFEVYIRPNKVEMSRDSFVWLMGKAREKVLKENKPKISLKKSLKTLQVKKKSVHL